MVPYFGDYDTTETVVIPFNTFSSDDPSASVTITNLAAADVEIHKDGSTTQRASDNGVTVTIDFDSITGNHIVAIDLSDNSDAGYYSAGSRYQVRMEGTTVDGATINAWIGAFSIGCTLRPTTDGRTLDVTVTGEAGVDFDNINGTIDAADLGADCITAAKIADDAIAAEHLAAGAIVAGTLAADCITSAKIADDAIGDEHWNVTGVALSAGAITDASLAGNMEIVFETDFATNYNATRNAWVTNAQDFVGTTAADPFNGQIVAASLTGHTVQTGDSYAYLGTNLGALGANATEAGGDGDHLTEAGGDGDHLTEAGGDGDHLTEAGGTGDQLTAVPWNASWDAEVQSECTDALNAYDPPTNAEMEARTVAVASYFDPASDKVYLGDGAHGGASAAITLADYSDFTGAGAENPNVLLSAEVATVTSQTEFTLATGSDQDDAYNDQSIVLYDDNNSDYPSVRVVSDYTGATKTVTIDSAADFTLGTDDSVRIFVTAPGTTAPTVSQIRAEIDSNSTQLAAIVEDTGTTLPDRLTNVGQHIESKVDGIDATATSIYEDTNITIPGAISGLNDVSAADVVNEWETQSQADPTGFHVNVMEVAGTSQTANDNGADINAILADTNELQTDDVPGLIAALNNFDPDLDKVYLANGAHGGAGASFTLDDYSDFQGSGSGSAAVTVTPVSGTLASRFTSPMLTLIQYEEIYYGPWVITDTDGDAIDLSGLALALVVYTLEEDATEVWRLTTGDSEITVSGDENNQLTLSDDATHTQTAGRWGYTLWNTTNNRPIQRGILAIERSAGPSPPS